MGVFKSAKDRNEWTPPGWPWELELFTLVFVIATFAIPSYLILTHEPPLLSSFEASLFTHTLDVWQRVQGYVWAMLLLGVYFLHWAAAWLTLNFVSTPFVYLISPTVFAAIAYSRFFLFFKNYPVTPQLVHGTATEIVLWLLFVQAVTWTLARARMRRHLARFDQIVWDICLQPNYDFSYFAKLIFRFRPIFYPPRMYRLCEEGIVVEGWSYLMAIPFYEIEGVAPASKGDIVSSAFYAATSMRSLLRIQLYDVPEPIFISPKNPQLFQRYCDQILTGRTPVLATLRPDHAPPVTVYITPYGEPESREQQMNPYFNV